ncbi:hypothetical protein GCM10009718_28120 [Isoptericola halotolerans]|uniref:DUF1269 domain-containing protein n=1 Tax=Isoptericola halotolerans TaxID=300560 RepID=A0ABX2A5Y4_9MICO|nr:DUF6325 family protein [Isoptericola halotolerans]NOV97338.1 hypothetical protein [Isoptericola halotolerans]
MTQDLSDPLDGGLGDLEESGPIDFLIIELPTDRATGDAAFPHLLDLVDRGIVRVLDLVVVRRQPDDTVTAVGLEELDDGSTGLEVFAGARSGLLDDEDLAEAAQTVEPGRTAVILVYENTWAAPFALALRRNGAQLVANGRIPVQALLASLDASDA